jgi:F0F1-type ATP synthase delta subunit
MLAAASRGALRTVRKSLTDLAAELPDAAGISGVSEGLFGVVRLLDQSGQLRRALGDPTTARAAKESLLDDLIGEQLDPLAMRVLEGEFHEGDVVVVDAADGELTLQRGPVPVAAA